MSIISNVESVFMVKAVKQGLRIDGRKLNSPRPIKMNLGLTSGNVEVQLGQSRVLSKISTEICVPKLDRPNEGIIKFTVHFPDHINKKKEDVDRIQLIIERGIKESNAIDLESLCILSGEQAWRLYVDVSVIQDDGNIVDCANLAVIAALKHHRRPDVTVVGSNVTIHSMLDRHPIPLSIYHLPICVTLGHIVDTSEEKTNTDPKIYTIVDPTSKEEKILQGKTTYSMTKYSQLCAMDKIGGVPLTTLEILAFAHDHVINIVKTWTKELEEQFEAAKLDDPKRRKQLLHAQFTNPINLFEPLHKIEEIDKIDDLSSIANP